MTQQPIAAKIQIEATTKAELDAIVDALASGLEVLEASRDSYKRKSPGVRRSLTVRIVAAPNSRGTELSVVADGSIGLASLENSHAIDYPNCGTVIDFPCPVRGWSEIKLGDWKQQHPDCFVSITYGASLTAKAGQIRACGHGNFIRIEGRGQIRFYWFTVGTCWDDLPIPQRVLYDWDSGNPPSHQIHFPDLKWFDPGYRVGREVMSREALIAEAQVRLTALLQNL